MIDLSKGVCVLTVCIVTAGNLNLATFNFTRAAAVSTTKP